MSDKSSTVTKRTSMINTKRRSVLAELGIKPGDAPTTTTKPKTTAAPVTTTARRSSVLVQTNKPSSPTVSKTNRTTATGSNKKTTGILPSSIKVERHAAASSSPIQSPTTSHSPRLSSNPKRRSIVPSNSNHPTTPTAMSPLTRRTSINHHTVSPTITARGSTNSSSSSSSHKRVSSPAGLESLVKVETIKQKSIEQDKEIQTLKENEAALKTQYENKINTLESEITKLKEELNKSLAKNHDAIDGELLKKEVEDELQKIHRDEIKNQERRLQSALQTLRDDHEHTIQKLKMEHQRQQEQLKRDHEASLLAQRERSSREKELVHEQDQATISKLQEQIQVIEESQTNSHVRKLQNELNTSAAALEEVKRHCQQQIETLERRYREEIRQLQTGSDDTAQAWLEKTKLTQQELDQLHDQLRLEGQQYAQTIEQLKEDHEHALEQSKELCETKETQLEEQSGQIENLLYQIETLQNSLEAATIRLEQHTAANRSSSSQTASFNRDETSSSSTTTMSSNCQQQDLCGENQQQGENHQSYSSRLEAKQKEIDDLKARLTELKDTHEAQINRLGQDKANALQELRKKIATLEQKLAATATPPHSPTRPHSAERNRRHSVVGSQQVEEEQKRLIRIAEQHRKEIIMLHEQYQVIVDTKNRELEDYAYRVKALVAAKQKEMEKLQTETNNTIDRYERDIEGYESKIIEYEKESNKLKDRVTHWEMISKNNEALAQDIKKDCTAHLDENEQLIRLVQQLQSEIHRS